MRGRSAGFQAVTIWRREFGSVLERLLDLCNLVDGAAVAGGPGPPLRPIDGAEIAALVRPFIPDGNAVRLEIGDVRIAREKPEKLVNNGFHMQLLGRQKREALAEVEPHLMAKEAERTGAGAIAALNATFAHHAQKVEISLHTRSNNVILLLSRFALPYFHSSISR